MPGNQFSDSIYGGPGDDTITSFALSGSAVRPGSGRDNVTFKGSARLWFDDAPGRVVVDVAAGNAHFFDVETEKPGPHGLRGPGVEVGIKTESSAISSCRALA